MAFLFFAALRIILLKLKKFSLIINWDYWEWNILRHIAKEVLLINLSNFTFESYKQILQIFANLKKVKKLTFDFLPYLFHCFIRILSLQLSYQLINCLQILVTWGKSLEIFWKVERYELNKLFWQISDNNICQKIFSPIISHQKSFFHY